MITDLSNRDLNVLARVLELYDEICSELAKAEAFPRNGSVLHIDSDFGYLGYVGYNNDGNITFQPAPE